MIRRLLVTLLASLALGTAVAPAAGATGLPTDVPASGYSICVAVMGVGGVCV